MNIESQRNLYIFDLTSFGKSHEFFNYQILKIIDECGQSPVFFGEQTHCMALLSRGPWRQLKFRLIKASYGRLSFLLRSYFNLIKLITLKRASHVVFLSSDYRLTPVLLLVAVSFRLIGRVTFIVHDPQSVAMSKVKILLIRRLARNRHFSCIVLSKCGQSIFKKHVKLDVRCLPHPLQPNILSTGSVAFEEKKIKTIVVPGRHGSLFIGSNMEKTFMAFSDNLMENGFRVLVFGKGVKDYEEGAIIYRGAFDNYSDYLEVIQDSSFVLIMDDPSNCGRANGVLFDGIASCTPLLYPSWSQYEEYEEFGPIGISYCSANLEKLILDLLNIESTRIRKFRESMQNFMELRQNEFKTTFRSILGS